MPNFCIHGHDAGFRLLSDIAMPDGDGFELIRKIRADECGMKATPAVAMSAFSSSECRDRALREGFDEYIAKPISPTELVATVERLACHRFTPGTMPQRSPAPSLATL